MHEVLPHTAPRRRSPDGIVRFHHLAVLIAGRHDHDGAERIIIALFGVALAWFVSPVHVTVRLFSADVRSATPRSGWYVHRENGGQFSPQSATTSWSGQEYVARVASVSSANLLLSGRKDGEEHRPLVLRRGPTLRRQRAVHRRAGRPSLWVSDAELGSVHDLHTAHSHALLAL